MPIHVRVVNPEHQRKSLFQCVINGNGKKCKQCKFIKKNAERCKLKTCTDEFCWIHLQKKFRVRVAESRIRINGHSIGLGLFARTNKPLDARILDRLHSHKASEEDKTKYLVFKKGELIGKYIGEHLSKKRLDDRYDYKDTQGTLHEQTAPYAFTVGHKIYDGLCKRNFMVYANDPTGTGLKPNMKPSRKSPNMMALRDIWQGEELLWEYGETYWSGEIAATKQRRQ